MQYPSRSLLPLAPFLLPFFLYAQPALIRRLQSNLVPVSLGRLDGQWHLTGYQGENSGWDGVHTLLTEDLAPTGIAKTWPLNAYHEAMSTHKLDNGRWLSFGRSNLPFADRYLYFVEHDAAGTVHAAHKWVDTTSTLTTLNYAHAYNADSSKLLTYFQNLQVKGFVCFDRNGELLWSRRLMSGNLIMWSLQTASDGGWYGFGRMSFNPDGSDPILVKLDTDGNWLWSHRYRIPYSDETALFARPTTDGGLLLTNTSIIDTLEEDQPYYATLLRTNGDGELLWHRVIGRADGPGRYQGGCAIERPDGSVLWAGSAKDSIADVFINGSMFLLRLDANGSTISANNYAHTGGGNADNVKFLNSEPPILTARVSDGDSYAMELIVFSDNGLPPCVDAPLTYGSYDWPITDTSFIQYTTPFTLVRDTLILSDPLITITTELWCIATEVPGSTAMDADIHVNIANGQLVLEAGERPLRQVTVHDATGRLLLRRDQFNGIGRIQLPMPEIVSGLLLVSVEEDTGARRSFRLVAP